jgi:hypothetical protein
MAMRLRRASEHCADLAARSLQAQRWPYIRAWAVWHAEPLYRVWQTLRHAEADQAPDNAIYRNADGTWVTMDAVEQPGLRRFLEVVAERFR